MANKIALTGSQVIAEFLVQQRVDTVFCITGAGNLAIVDALEQRPEIRVIYSHHEQAAVMEAQGYSRVSGSPGVVLVTTGGGTSNTLTGVLSAQLDSIPLLLISGNESSYHCEAMADFRAYGVQGFDSVAVLTPVTKSSCRINTVDEIGEKLLNSWGILQSGRAGVAHVDVPMDLQRKFSSFGGLEFSGKISVQSKVKPLSHSLELLTAIVSAERPIFYLGNGLRSPGIRERLMELWRLTGLPTFFSWSAIDMVEETFPSNCGRIGIYGDRAANLTLQKADLVIAIGTRLAIPQIGYDKKDFGRRAAKWVIDIDEVELSKFNMDGWHTLAADGNEVLSFLLDNLASAGAPVVSWTQWFHEVSRLRSELPRLDQIGPGVSDQENFVHSADVMVGLSRLAAPDAVIVTDVGAGLLTGHYALEIQRGQRLFTSQGLGEMGFGLPAAIGAWFADPERQVICLNTDGAIMMNMQELELVNLHKIPLKLFIFNNGGYGMIKVSQENLFDGRINGVDRESGISFPDFRLVAETFKFSYRSISSNRGLVDQLQKALASDFPELIEVRMEPNQKYLPRLGTSKAHDGTLVSPPLEDLDPKLDIEKLESFLGYKAHPQSYLARGLDYES